MQSIHVIKGVGGSVAALCLTLGMTSQANGAATIFLSEIGAIDSGVSVNNPALNLTDGPGSLHVWVIPDAGQALNGIALNLVSSNPGVVELTGATVYNPNIVVGAVDINDRWQSVSSGVAAADAINNFQGFRINVGSGMDPSLNGSGGLLDELYDSSSGAFLFATVDYSVVGLGTTDLFLQVGDARIAPFSGTSADVSVAFGADETTLLTGGSSDVSSSVADATITVVPEPATLGLIGAGGALALVRRRRSGV